VHHRVAVRGVGIGAHSSDPDRAHIRGPGWTLTTLQSAAADEVSLEGTWRTTKDRIGSDQMKAHLDAISQARNATWTSFGHLTPEMRQGMGVMAQVMGWLTVAFGLGFVLLLAAGWWGSKALLRTPRVRPGTTMEAALVVTSEAELLSRLGAQRCECGAPSPGASAMVREASILLEGSERTPLRWSCARCQKTQRIWVREADRSEAA
jgi:hypothetical protein